MQSNGRVNDSRANISHLHKTKKPLTQPATGSQEPAAGSSEHLCSSEQQSSSERMDSSERMNRGGGGWVAARRLYIYTYTAP